jgi:hypothetical protein
MQSTNRRGISFLALSDCAGFSSSTENFPFDIITLFLVRFAKMHFLSAFNTVYTHFLVLVGASFCASSATAF